MSKLTTLRSVKKLLMPSLFAAAVAALLAFHTTGVSAAGRTWSIVAHFEYQDGFEFDYVVARGVDTSEMASRLAECGASHWTRSVVGYYCYPVPE